MGVPARRVPDRVGQHRFKVTPEILAKVEELAALGMQQIWIARALGVGHTTYFKNIKEVAEFADAYAKGRAQALEKLYTGAMKNATVPTAFNPHGNLSAQFGLIDRIEGRLKDAQGQAQPSNTETREVIFRITKPTSASASDD